MCVAPSWDSYDDKTRFFMRSIFAGYIVMWLLIVTLVLFYLCSYQSRTPIAKRQWERRLRTYMCLGLLVRETENDALSSMAESFAELFRIREIGHRLVATDIAVGFVLIRSMQARREITGRIPQITAGHSDCCNDGEVPKYDPNCARIARKGEQPELPREDWERMREAKRFACFAVGSYGYKLQALMQPCCLCAGVPCGFRLPSCCTPYDTRQLSVLRSSGCTCLGMLRVAPCDFSHFNANTFLQVTDMPKSRLHSCNLEVLVDRPVYYLSVCPERTAIVLAIRGTMSVSDCITDCNCKNVPFAGPGLAPLDPTTHYVHAGMFQAALTMRREIYTDGLLELVTQNPSYQVVIVGHSLGAGTASVLTTVLLHDESFAPYRDRLRCYAYAPPLVMSPALCTSPLVLNAITAVVWRHDIVSRLSMANLLKLRTQLEQCFEAVTPHSHKWKIMWNAVQRKHSKNWRVISDTPLDWHKLSKEVLITPEVKGNDLSIPVIDGENKDSSELVTYMAGRIYHLLPRKGVKSDAENGAVVYPASQETFQEIAVQSSMFLNHMPYLYTLKNLQLPAMSP